MKVWLEKSHWGDAIELSVGVHWTNWHLREASLEVCILRWIYSLFVSFK